MNALSQMVERGGPVMYVIMALSVLLYSQCAKLLITLHQARGALGKGVDLGEQQVSLLEAQQEELEADFRTRRLMIASMISAAPLLGLLGTVNGMARTFESLSSQLGQRSMGDLAGGISEVLVATESGLAVAIPALVLLYLARREIDKHQLRLEQLKERVWRRTQS